MRSVEEQILYIHELYMNANTSSVIKEKNSRYKHLLQHRSSIYTKLVSLRFEWRISEDSEHASAGFDSIIYTY